MPLPIRHARAGGNPVEKVMTTQWVFVVVGPSRNRHALSQQQVHAGSRVDARDDEPFSGDIALRCHPSAPVMSKPNPDGARA